MSQPKKLEERMREGDENIVELGPFSLSKNEAHATQLGMIGFLAGVAFFSGFQEQAVAVSALLLSIAVGAKKAPQTGNNKAIAVLTKRHEPWWFIMSYVVSATVGGMAVGSI